MIAFNVVRPSDQKARTTGSPSARLLAHKLVVWLVFIERADHPVAATRGYVRACFESVRFPKAHKIRPMRRPSLAITRAGQHLVDQLGVPLRAASLTKASTSPATAAARITRYNRVKVRLSARIELQPLRLQPNFHEGIDGHKPRRGRPRDFLERPASDPPSRRRLRQPALIDPRPDEANGLGVEGSPLGGITFVQSRNSGSTDFWRCYRE